MNSRIREFAYWLILKLENCIRWKPRVDASQIGKLTNGWFHEIWSHEFTKCMRAPRGVRQLVHGSIREFCNSSIRQVVDSFQNKFRTRPQNLSLSIRLNRFSIRQFVNLWIHFRTSPEQVESNAQEQNPVLSKNGPVTHAPLNQMGVSPGPYS